MRPVGSQQPRARSREVPPASLGGPDEAWAAHRITPDRQPVEIMVVSTVVDRRWLHDMHRRHKTMAFPREAKPCFLEGRGKRRGAGGEWLSSLAQRMRRWVTDTARLETSGHVCQVCEKARARVGMGFCHVVERSQRFGVSVGRRGCGLDWLSAPRAAVGTHGGSQPRPIYLQLFFLPSPPVKPAVRQRPPHFFWHRRRSASTATGRASRILETSSSPLLPPPIQRASGRHLLARCFAKSLSHVARASRCGTVRLNIPTRQYQHPQWRSCHARRDAALFIQILS